MPATDLTTILTSEWLRRGIAIAVTWVLVFILVRYLSKWIEKLDEHVREMDIDSREMKALDKLLDYVIIIVGILITISLLDLTSVLYSLLTAAGVATIVIGFAVKDVAANFISGIFLLIDQTFVVGDAVKVGNYSGQVQKIALRSTTIATWDGPVVTIPNSLLATEPVINYSANAERRVNLTISIASENDLQAAMTILRDLVEAEPRRVAEKEPTIYVSDVHDHAIDITVLFHTPSADWFAVSSDYRRAVAEAFKQNRVELAVPVYKCVSTTPHVPPPSQGGQA